MFDSDAEAVFAKVEANMETMRQYWNDKPENMGQGGTALVNIAWMEAQDCALEWIDANCPKAWYRPMFVN